MHVHYPTRDLQGRLDLIESLDQTDVYDIKFHMHKHVHILDYEK